MALSSEQLALFDAGGMFIQGYVYIHIPTPVFSAPIEDYIEREGAYVALETGTPTLGTLNDAKSEMTCYLHHSGGYRNGGSQRVRGTDIPLSRLLIGRASAGREEGQIIGLSGATLTVYDEFRPFIKAPFIAALPTPVQYKDELLYPGDDEAQPPVADAGTDRFIVTWDSTANIALSGSFSHAVRAGATITGYSWNIKDGSVTSGSTSSATLQVNFPRGERWISLTVTDSNGVTHTTHRLIVVKRPIDCIPAQVTAFTHSPYGNSFGLKLETPLLVSDIPPRAKVLFAERENYGDTLIGFSERFSGWLQEETETLENPSIQRYTTDLVVEDVMSFGNRNNVFPQSLNAVDTDDVGGWFEMPGADIDRMMDYLFQWHSNILSCCSFRWSGLGSTYPFPKLTTSGGSFWQNVDRLARSFGRELTVSPLGILKVVGDPHVQPSAAQAAEFDLPTQRSSDTVFHFSRDRYSTYTLPAERIPQYYWSTALGIVATNDLENVVVVGCVAPSNAPGFGLTAGSRTDYLTVSQEELNVWKANEFAAKEGSSLGELVLVVLNPAMVLDVSNREYVTVDLPEGAVSRYDLSGRWTVERVEFEYSGAKKGAKYYLRKEIVASKPARTLPQIADDQIEQAWDGFDGTSIAGSSVVTGYESMALTQSELEQTLRKTRLKVYLSEFETDGEGNSGETDGTGGTVDLTDAEAVYTSNAEKNGGYWEVTTRLSRFMASTEGFYTGIESEPDVKDRLNQYVNASLLNADVLAVGDWVDYIVDTDDTFPVIDRELVTEYMYCEDSAAGGLNQYILNEVDSDFWDRWFKMSACISQEQYDDWFDRGNDVPLGSFTGYVCYTYPPETLNMTTTHIHDGYSVSGNLMDWSATEIGESRRFQVKLSGKYEDDDYIKDGLYVFDKSTENITFSPLTIYIRAYRLLTDQIETYAGVSMVGSPPPYNPSGVYTFSMVASHTVDWGFATAAYLFYDTRSEDGTGTGSFKGIFTDLGTY